MSVTDRMQQQRDASLMRILLDTESFACYQRHLQAEIEDALGRVLTAPLAEVEAARGLYQGLRRAQQLPHRVLAQGKEPN